MADKEFRFLSEEGIVSQIGSFDLKQVTNKDLLEVVGSFTGFSFARKFVENPCIWYSCPLVSGNLVNDFIISLFSRSRSFRNITVSVGKVNDAKFLLFEKDDKKELYVSSEATRDYILSLQDLNISPINPTKSS